MYEVNTNLCPAKSRNPEIKKQKGKKQMNAKEITRELIFNSFGKKLMESDIVDIFPQYGKFAEWEEDCVVNGSELLDKLDVAELAVIANKFNLI